MNNKIYLLNLYPNNHNIFNFLFIILFILLVPLSFFIKIYDSYYTTGLISCNNDSKDGGNLSVEGATSI